MASTSPVSAKGVDRRIHAVLRVTLGLILVIAALGKAASLRSGTLQETAIWRLLGDQAGPVMAVALLEFAAGVALVLDLGTRSIAAVSASALLITTAVILLREGTAGRACGCFGALDREVLDRGLGLAARNGMLIFAFVFVAMFASSVQVQRREGGSQIQRG